MVASQVEPSEIVIVAELADAHHVVGLDGDTLYLRDRTGRSDGRFDGGGP